MAKFVFKGKEYLRVPEIDFNNCYGCCFTTRSKDCGEIREFLGINNSCLGIGILIAATPEGIAEHTKRRLGVKTDG